MTNVMPHRNLYTRLKVSTNGVGVFAIRNIPEGLRLFQGDIGTVVHVPRVQVDKIEDEELRRMYFDFCPTHKGTFIAPTDFNQLTMSWYMNHSGCPNVLIDDNMQFTAGRVIPAGEELTTDYAKFSDHASAEVVQWNLIVKI